MKELSPDTLIEYIRHAIDLESNVITQERVIEEFRSFSDGVKPQLETLPMPKRQIVTAGSAQMDFKDEMFLKVFLWVLVVLGIFGFFVLLGDEQFSMIGFLPLLLFTGLPGFALFDMKRGKQKTEKALIDKQEEYNERYEKELKRIKGMNEDKWRKYKRDYAEWEASDSQVMEKLNKTLEESRKSLSIYYSADAIYPKYHNLPALTSIYEYLTSGRCDQLTGPNGAYNLYENELRQNTIVSQLNVIISNLEQIRQNQYTLYQELVKLNMNVRSVANELNTIGGYMYTLTQLTALNTVYNGIASSSVSAMAFYNALT